MDIPQSIYSLGDGNLDYFYLGAIMNKAAKNSNNKKSKGMFLTYVMRDLVFFDWEGVINPKI